jgi:uncharacterized short protein YbdD (DUF466 family)
VDVTVDRANVVGLTASFAEKLRRIVRGGWWWLRQVSGDADYENYLRRAAQNSCAPISAEEFYLRELRRKHSKINRCC